MSGNAQDNVESVIAAKQLCEIVVKEIKEPKEGVFPDLERIKTAVDGLVKLEVADRLQDNEVFRTVKENLAKVLLSYLPTRASKVAQEKVAQMFLSLRLGTKTMTDIINANSEAQNALKLFSKHGLLFVEGLTPAATPSLYILGSRVVAEQNKQPLAPVQNQPRDTDYWRQKFSSDLQQQFLVADRIKQSVSQSHDNLFLIATKGLYRIEVEFGEKDVPTVKSYFDKVGVQYEVDYNSREKGNYFFYIKSDKSKADLVKSISDSFRQFFSENKVSSAWKEARKVAKASLLKMNQDGLQEKQNYLSSLLAYLQLYGLGNPSVEDPDIQTLLETLPGTVGKEGELIKAEIQQLAKTPARYTEDKKTGDISARDVIRAHVDRQDRVHQKSLVAMSAAADLKSAAASASAPPIPKKSEALLKKESEISKLNELAKPGNLSKGDVEQRDYLRALWKFVISYGLSDAGVRALITSSLGLKVGSSKRLLSASSKIEDFGRIQIRELLVECLNEWEKSGSLSPAQAESFFKNYINPQKNSGLDGKEKTQETSGSPAPVKRASMPAPQPSMGNPEQEGQPPVVPRELKPKPTSPRTPSPSPVAPQSPLPARATAPAPRSKPVPVARQASSPLAALMAEKQAALSAAEQAAQAKAEAEARVMGVSKEEMMETLVTQLFESLEFQASLRNSRDMRIDFYDSQKAAVLNKFLQNALQGSGIRVTLNSGYIQGEEAQQFNFEGMEKKQISTGVKSLCIKYLESGHAEFIDGSYKKGDLENVLAAKEAQQKAEEARALIIPASQEKVTELVANMLVTLNERLKHPGGLDSGKYASYYTLDSEAMAILPKFLNQAGVGFDWTKMVHNESSNTIILSESDLTQRKIDRIQKQCEDYLVVAAKQGLFQEASPAAGQQRGGGVAINSARRSRPPAAEYSPAPDSNA